MIKLKDLLTELQSPPWNTKTMGKPLSNSEISALKKKLKTPSVRKGPKKQLMPPNLSDREKAYIIFVMLKKRRDKNYEKSGGQFIKKHWTKLSKAEKEKLGENSYYRKAMKYSLMERVDYMDTAKQLVKKYNLRSKVKMGSGKNFGDYIPETDTITLRPSYKSMKEFYMTILHEIQHAKDAYNLGVKKFMKKYTQAGTVANYQGLDPHDDNKWEEKAENFAKAEIRKYI